jgi:hypothetical protein
MRYNHARSSKNCNRNIASKPYREANVAAWQLHENVIVSLLVQTLFAYNYIIKHKLIIKVNMKIASIESFKVSEYILFYMKFNLNFAELLNIVSVCFIDSLQCVRSIGGLPIAEGISAWCITHVLVLIGCMH